MSLDLKNNHWRPSASIPNLQARATILAKIRQFFADRNVLEVETPLLSRSTVTDPFISSIATEGGHLFLQTSPEYAMKRLLSAGIGSIYQICKAFRSGDVGHLHNPEFTMLEWYRINYDHHDLMSEMDELLMLILKTDPAERMTCAELYQNYTGLNPHSIELAELVEFIHKNIDFSSEIKSKTMALDLIFSHTIQPFLGKERPLFIYDFPSCQAALSRIRPGNPSLASRFEVYFQSIELANGFHELQNAAEQRERFNADLMIRQLNHLRLPPLDEHFLSSLEAGLPDCAGVALGLDRLMMLALNLPAIQDVISFSVEKI